MLEELSVLRECRRVLKRDGRLVVVTIEIAEGLGAAERAQATELGPEDLVPEALYETWLPSLALRWS